MSSRQPPAPPLRLIEPIPVGDATEIEPIVISDPARDGIDIADLETALMDLEGA
jgi:hypothetical protein